MAEQCRAGQEAAPFAGGVTEDEVRDVLANLEGVHWLVAALLYGAGLRLMEALRLRVQDVDFKRREVLVRNGKGLQGQG